MIMIINKTPTGWTLRPAHAYPEPVAQVEDLGLVPGVDELAQPGVRVDVKVGLQDFMPTASNIKDHRSEIVGPRLAIVLSD